MLVRRGWYLVTETDMGLIHMRMSGNDVYMLQCALKFESDNELKVLQLQVVVPIHSLLLKTWT
jgi:hypothetical protein